MKINKINQPAYEITLTAEETSELWFFMKNLSEQGKLHSFDRENTASKWYNRLEDVRSAGGFDQ